MISARVAVIQFPGVNCEAETLRGLERAGLPAEVFRWTRPPVELREFAAYVLPGGFSYQDRVRAGALAAKEDLMEVLEQEADRGKPVLGICNGAQVLVEAGLVPGGHGVELALAANRMPGRGGYYARWIYVRVEDSPCLFTRGLPAGTVLPLPVAHGEGRFTSRDRARLKSLLGAGQIPLRYCRVGGEAAGEFPDNPNGAELGAAAVASARGNVLALMPHPERALDAAGLPSAVCGEWDERRRAALERSQPDAPGPGLAVFEGLRRHLEDR